MQKEYNTIIYAKNDLAGPEIQGLDGLEREGTHTSAKALLRRESKVTSEWLWMDGLLEL